MTDFEVCRRGYSYAFSIIGLSPGINFQGGGSSQDREVRGGVR